MKSWILVVLIVLVLRATFVEAMVVPSGSMANTLQTGDAILVNKFIYGIAIPGFGKKVIPGTMPRHGEIVAFRSPLANKNLVKRCIAVAGDTLEIINKVVFVNGKRRQEPYVQHRDERVFPGADAHSPLYQRSWRDRKFIANMNDLFRFRDNFGPVVIPDDCIFAMGDNRDTSFDSRFWGPVPRELLLGKPIFVYLSIDIGEEAENLWELLRIWKWRGVRLDRIGKVLLS